MDAAIKRNLLKEEVVGVVVVGWGLAMDMQGESL